MYDIREAHKTDSMTADEGSVPTKDTVMDQIQQAMDSKTGAEFIAKQFCDTMQIPREKVTESEMIMFLGDNYLRIVIPIVYAHFNV